MATMPTMRPTPILALLILAISTACVSITMPNYGDDSDDGTTGTDDEAGETDTTPDLPAEESANTEDTTDASDTSAETETDETADTGETGEPDCWTLNGFEWCTVTLDDLLVPTPCDGDVGPGPTTWPYKCAEGQTIDATGWDDAWCNGSCWGLRDGVVVSVLPECMIDTLGAVPASEWSAGCTEGEPLPIAGTGWEEWRCGENTCAARIGALWTTPVPQCMSEEWLACEL